MSSTLFLILNRISYCLHNPYAVSAGLKLLVDGISVYKKYIVKLEDLFFNVILIHFHYTASLDENIKSNRDLINITNPNASVTLQCNSCVLTFFPIEIQEYTGRDQQANY